MCRMQASPLWDEVRTAPQPQATFPIDVVDWFLGMNADHLGSAQLTQDVLLMCGEHDSFQPPSLTHAQADALTAARSVTVRMFTKAEHADQHCQIGNIGLACRVLTTWLRNRSPESTGRD
jgi:pimeloyl-ACP methyl ester carboxylesterase